MKKIGIAIINCFSLFYASGQSSMVTFASSDTAMQSAFYRAKEIALRYKGNPTDPVGPWYEAALPSRYAFCMRDVSHQCIGAEILGMSKENKNMFTLFAENISESKDWCSYWEINKYGKPAPEDYRNDREFWYNLNANFDVMFACWRLYLWTGDSTYIKSPAFERFFEISVTGYIDRWILHEDSLLTRPRLPNSPVPFNDRDNFHRSRGLASYSEGVPDLKIGVDLVAAIYRALLSYASVLELNGNITKAAFCEKKAERYWQKIEQDWWDGSAALYQTYYSSNGTFGKGGSSGFLLWFDALKDTMRKRKTIEQLIAEKTNIESESYLPLILYQNGYRDKARDYILHLTNTATPRREYPEVSYAVVEAVVKGLMGIEPDASKQRISTLYRGKKGVVSELDNLNVLKTEINVKHEDDQTVFFNKGNNHVYWRAMFAGRYKKVMVDGVTRKAGLMQDANGNVSSFADITVNPGKMITVRCR